MMANSSSMSRPKSYDDDEGLLQDQGLEVVVLPYQPPPPPPPPRTTRSGEGISKTGLRRPAALSSTPPPPPPPPPPPRPSSFRPHDKFGKFGKSSPRPEFDIPDEDGTSAPMSVGDAYSGGGVGRSNLGDGFSSPVGGAPTPRSRWVMEEAARCHHPQHPQHLEQDVGETSGRKQPLSPVSQARKDGSPREGCQPHVRSHSVPVAHSHCSQGASAGTAASLARATSCVADHPNSQFRESGRDGGTGDQSSKSSSKQLHHSNNTKNNTKNNSNNNNNTNNTNNTKNNNNPNNKPKKSKQKSHDKLSYLQMAKLGYQELIHAIIRPPRSSYPIEALGPKEFRFCNATIRRRDFVLVNERGLGLHCCLWRRVLDWDDDEEGVEEEYEFGGDRDGVDGVREQPPPRSQQQQEPQQQQRQHQDDVVFSSSSSSSLSRSNLGDDTYGYGERAEHDDDAWGIEQYLNKQQFKPVSPPDIPGNSNAEHGNNSKTNNSCTDHDRSSSNPTNSHRRLDPVVVYLHGNSSSRVEVLPQLSHLLSLGVAVLSFDFAGSGHSEGDYVSLGYYEREDLQTVISHLRASGNFSHIALWGRSMGAATALMYGSRDPTVSCMVLDSPFTDLTRLAEEMVEKGREQGVAVPNFVLTVIMRMIKSSVKHQAGFNIKHISPISHVGKCFIPAMFVAGEHDDFIHKRHSELLHEKYAGDKNLVIVDGDHNSPRPRFLLQSACLFLQSCMRLPASLELVVPLGANLLAPPWMLWRSGLGVAPSLRGRAWISSDAGRTKDGKQGKKDGNHPPQLPFDGKGGQARKALVSKEKEANADASAACLAAGAPPDMSKRQKEIQSSLFKMLGQDD